ncbi:amidohydrolase [Clostridiaceae bacterium M8S5]|nr:amidohydrolase [Clostridiaceae bacterium M8S5]
MLFIKNGKVFTMKNNEIINADILIENGKIKEIGNDLVVPLNAEIIDASGCNVMPGFIEAHSHIGLEEDSIGFEGSDINEMTDPITPHLRAIDGINPMDRNLKEAIEGGITCACTGPGSGNVVGGQAAVIKMYGKKVDDMVVKAPAAMKIAFGENPKRVYNEQKKTPMTRMATAALLREALFKAKKYVSKQEASINGLDKEPEFDMKLEALAKVIKKEIPLKAHAHRADDMFTALRIAKEFGVDITLDHCTEGHLIADYLAEEGKYAIVGPSLTHRSKFELQNLTFKTPAELHKAGVKIAITTDSPVIPLQHLPMCAGLAVKAGLDKMEALKAITINAAQILGVDNRIGSLEAGKDADILICKGHPLEDIGYQTVATIIDGKVVYKR